MHYVQIHRGYLLKSLKDSKILHENVIIEAIGTLTSFLRVFRNREISHDYVFVRFALSFMTSTMNPRQLV